jgi:hypothetical protein
VDYLLQVTQNVQSNMLEELQKHNMPIARLEQKFSDDLTDFEV